MIINQIHRKIVKGEETGTPVMVQASENFSVGDTFGGTRRFGSYPQIVSTDLGISPTLISADGKVAVTTQTLYSSAKVLDVYVKKDSGWAVIQVELPDMTDAGESYSNISFASIDEYGSLITWVFKNFTLAIDVNASSLSATAVKIEPNEVDASSGSYNGYVGVSFTQIDSITLIGGGYGVVTGKATFKKDDATTSWNVGVIARIGTSITSENVFGVGGVYSSYYKPDAHSGLLTNDNNANKVFFFGCYDLGRCRAELELGKLVKINTGSRTVSFDYITRNGEYGRAGKSIYKINKETGTSTLVSTITSSRSVYAIDENNKYWADDRGNIFLTSDLAGANAIATNCAGTPIQGSYCDLDNGLYFTYYGGYKRNMALVDEEGEYIIHHTINVPDGSDIYGITTNSMMMGEVKEAMQLFGVTNIGLLQSKTIVPSAEEQTIVADEGYGGLREVIIAGDPELVAKNIKNGVEIFGVTGTLTSIEEEEETPTYINYIQSSGTQYIDTGVCPYKTKTEITFQCLVQPTTTTAYIIGAWTTGNNRYYPTVYRKTIGFVCANRSNTYTTLSAYDTSVHTVIYNDENNKVYFDGTEKTTVSDLSTSVTNSIYLFAVHGSSGAEEPCACRIMSVKITDKTTNTLVRDLKPCKDTAGVYCLYDEVEKKFYYNAGSGSFSGG